MEKHRGQKFLSVCILPDSFLDVTCTVVGKIAIRLYRFDKDDTVLWLTMTMTEVQSQTGS